MKYQVLFSLKNNEKVFINVVCCSRDWHFKVKNIWNQVKGDLESLACNKLLKKQALGFV